jgi:hypothetical protein
MARALSEKVRVTMHLSGGYTKVLVEQTEGVGMAGGGIYLEIPTKIIPLHLRGMGSRFVLVATAVSSAAEAQTMSAEQIRNAQAMSVEEIKDE